MKKIVILGSGTAGLISAAMVKNFWGQKVDVTVYYDASKKSIGVGESTTPLIHQFINLIGETPQSIIKKIKATIKLGINFKNWVPGTEFFHGFNDVHHTGLNEWSSATYSILNDCYNGGILFNEATTTLPNKDLQYGFAYHLDTKDFCDFLEEKLKDSVKFVDDVAVQVHSDGKNIQSIEFQKSGKVTSDYYIDASGFNAVLFKHLNPKWNDISEWLPIDRAIPQQVPYEFEEIPSHTVAEATDNGWIWKIPIGNRYGTGYLYSSRFTSDDEARTKYNKWLLDNFNTELNTDRVIKYKPGYYEDYWIGNCLAVGLSSGFVEPLESTGIHIIIRQLYDFVYLNANLKDLKYNKVLVNSKNKQLYEDIIDFICLHYNTGRTGSDFWNYMDKNKKEWVINFKEKCKEDFIDIRSFRENYDFSIWTMDSYIQISNGLKLFNKKSIQEYLDNKFNKDQILDFCLEHFNFTEMIKSQNQRISHKEFLDEIHK